MAAEEDCWVRPLTKIEEFLEIAHQKGFMLTCYCLTLNSKQPLQEDHLRKSLIHLLRLVVNICLIPNQQ